jgi:hypothetical protein
MVNQLCFTVKIRSGARTPLEVVCDPLCVNDNVIAVKEGSISASAIAEFIRLSLRVHLLKIADKAEPITLLLTDKV